MKYALPTREMATRVESSGFLHGSGFDAVAVPMHYKMSTNAIC